MILFEQITVLLRGFPLWICADQAFIGSRSSITDEHPFTGYNL